MFLAGAAKKGTGRASLQRLSKSSSTTPENFNLIPLVVPNKLRIVLFD